MRRIGRYCAGLALAAAVAACSDDAAERRRALGPHPSPGEALRAADAGRGGRLFRQCAVCHAIGKGAVDRDGPNLFGVMGAPVAANSPRFAYTGVLRALGGTWTPERMDAWLAAPAKMAPGTRMAFPGVADPLDRADIIAYLRTQADRP
ncbi:c-type cytochrome [Methylobacterium sp. NEAU 140]|uniref:c-type cytochrome n=1 Tax=Methylobacterium sp. NEAU 140 TaxID=3064945 RepID=UPI002735DA8F|nr:c-type cytochrome [Methylobacterium sp. NEAU 140]MDP4022576.1 c-type cytochrome [Methylobacterium sp. NEAU 140]